MHNEDFPEILVVDDDAAAARSVAGLLDRHGYRVATSATGGPALRCAKHLRPKLIVASSGPDGADDARTLVQWFAERLGTPVVLLGASEESKRGSRTGNGGGGAYGYVPVPFGERELITAVESALLRRELERELASVRAELAQKSALLEGVLGSIDDAILARDCEGAVLLCNQAGKAEQLASLALTASARVLDAHGTALPAGQLPMVRAIKGEAFRNDEVMLVARGGKRWVSVTATPLRDRAGKVYGGVAVSRDVTAAKALQERLEHLSFTDELTGLYNRRGFMTLAQQQLRLADRSGELLMLLFADVNGLKDVNDALGHEVGDALLLDAAQVLQSAFRSSDIVARLGGDEFVVLLINPSATSAEVAKYRLEACIAHFNASKGRPYRLSLSVGVCESTAGSDRRNDLQRMLADADAAMYQVKQDRKKRGSGSLPAVVLDEQFCSGIWSSASRAVPDREGENPRKRKGTGE